MKKLLAVLLSALLVLSAAAFSVAAPAFNGEVKVIYDMPEDKDAVGKYEAALEWTGSINDTVSYGAKVVFPGDSSSFEIINPDYLHDPLAKPVVSINTTHSIGLDYASFQIATSADSFIKMGYFGFNPNTERDLIGTGFDDVKDDFTIQYEAKLSPEFTFDIAAVADQDKDSAGPLYGLKLGYANETFGVSVGYEGWEDFSGFQVTAGYNIAEGWRGYIAYTSLDDVLETTTNIVGFKYDAAPYLFRAEMDLEDEDNNYAVRFGYTFANGVAMEINNTSSNTNISFKVAF